MLLQIDSVEHAGVLLADPDTQPKWERSILIEGERIKAVSDGFACHRSNLPSIKRAEAVMGHI